MDNSLEEALYGMVGTSDCHKVGIMGGCGLECHVYEDGRCKVPDEMIDRLETDEDKEIHESLYGRLHNERDNRKST